MTIASMLSTDSVPIESLPNNEDDRCRYDDNGYDERDRQSHHTGNNNNYNNCDDDNYNGDNNNDDDDDDDDDDCYSNASRSTVITKNESTINRQKLLDETSGSNNNSSSSSTTSSRSISSTNRDENSKKINNNNINTGKKCIATNSHAANSSDDASDELDSGNDADTAATTSKNSDNNSSKKTTVKRPRLATATAPAKANEISTMPHATNDGHLIQVKSQLMAKLLEDCTLQMYRYHSSVNGYSVNSGVKSNINSNNNNSANVPATGVGRDENVESNNEYGPYLDLELSLDDQQEEFESFLSSKKNTILLRTQLSVRVQTIIDKLLNSEGRDLRRALFSLKQIFQDDKDLVHEFVQNDGLACLIKVGSEADQNHQNYILRALGQVMIYVDGMNGVIGHNETVQWLYTLIASQYRLVAKTALKLLLVFVEYSDNNCLLFCQALRTVDEERGAILWTNIMKLFLESNLVKEDTGDNYTDSELFIYAMTLINKTLAGIPDQDTYYDFVDPLEELGMEEVIKAAFSKRQSQTDEQLLIQFKTYEQVLRMEDGEETTTEEDEQQQQQQLSSHQQSSKTTQNNNNNSNNTNQSAQLHHQNTDQISSTRNRSKSIVNLLAIKGEEQHQLDSNNWTGDNHDNQDIIANRRKSRRHSSILSPNQQQQERPNKQHRGSLDTTNNRPLIPNWQRKVLERTQNFCLTHRRNMSKSNVSLSNVGQHLDADAGDGQVNDSGSGIKTNNVITTTRGMQNDDKQLDLADTQVGSKQTRRNKQQRYTKDTNNNDCDTTTANNDDRLLISHVTSTEENETKSTSIATKCPGHKQIIGHTQMARGLHQRASISSCSSSDSYASYGYVSESGNSTDNNLNHHHHHHQRQQQKQQQTLQQQQARPITSLIKLDNKANKRIESTDSNEINQNQNQISANQTTTTNNSATNRKPFATYKIRHRQQQKQRQDDDYDDKSNDDESSSSQHFLAELDQLTEQLTQRHHVSDDGNTSEHALVARQLNDDDDHHHRHHHGAFHGCHDDHDNDDEHDFLPGDDDDDANNDYVDDDDDDDDDDVGDDQDNVRVAAMLRSRRQFRKLQGLTNDDSNSRSGTIKSSSSTMSTSSRLTTSSGISTTSSSPSVSMSSGHFNSLEMMSTTQQQQQQQQHGADGCHNNSEPAATTTNTDDHIYNNDTGTTKNANANNNNTDTVASSQEASWMKPTMMQQRQPSIIVRTNQPNSTSTTCSSTTTGTSKSAPIVTSATIITNGSGNNNARSLAKHQPSSISNNNDNNSNSNNNSNNNNNSNSKTTLDKNAVQQSPANGNSKSVKSIQERLFSNNQQPQLAQKSLQSVLANQINASKAQQQQQVAPANNVCKRLPPRPASSNAIIGNSEYSRNLNQSSTTNKQNNYPNQQLQQQQQSQGHNHLFKWENLMQKGVTRPLLINDLDFTDLHDDDDDNILNQQQQQQPKTLHTSSSLSIDSQDSFDSGTGSGSPNLNQRSMAPPPLPPPPMSSMSWFNTIGGFSANNNHHSSSHHHHRSSQQNCLLSPSPPYDNDTMSLSGLPNDTTPCSTPAPIPPPSPPPACDSGRANINYNNHRNSVCLYNTMVPNGLATKANNGVIFGTNGCSTGGMRSASSMSSLYFSNSTNSLTLSSKYGNKSKKTMKLFWKEVKEDKSLLARLTKRRGTIWDEIKPAPIDTVKLEQLFESKAKDLLLLSKGRGQDGLGGVKKIEITVLDAKRSNAINIGMTKLPPMRTIKSAILKMDSTIMNREGIEKILTTMMPTEEEKSRIIEAQLANPDTPLGTAEQFLLNLASISALEARLKLWAFQLDYVTIEKEVAEPLMDLKQAIDEIEKSETFRIVLGTLLAIGNFLNSSDAKGFQIDYLSKVPEVKDTVHKHSLLHHLCQFIQEKYPQPNQTSDLYSEFGAVNRASKIDFNEVAKSLQKMQSDCKVSWDYLKIVAKHDGLASMMNNSSSNSSAGGSGGNQSNNNLNGSVGLVTTTVVLPSSRSSRSSTSDNNNNNNNKNNSGNNSGNNNNNNNSNNNNNDNSTQQQQVQTKTTKISDFLTDCAERIMVLMVIHRRVLNRFNKLLVYLGCPSSQIKQTQPQQILKIINEFALEYRTKRERVLEMMQKKQNFKERNKTRGKLILNSDHYLMLQQQQAKQQQLQLNSDKLQPSISMINLATPVSSSSSMATSAVAAAMSSQYGPNNNQLQQHRYSSHSPVNSSEQLKRDEQLRQLLGSRDSFDEGHWSSTMTNTTKLIRSRHNQQLQQLHLTNGSRQNSASSCHQEETEEEEEEEALNGDHQSSYYNKRLTDHQQQQQQPQRCLLQRGHSTSNDDEILDSLVQTATAKCARGEPKNRQRSKLSRFGCERKSLRRTLRNGLEIGTNGQM